MIGLGVLGFDSDYTVHACSSVCSTFRIQTDSSRLRSHVSSILFGFSAKANRSTWSAKLLGFLRKPRVMLLWWLCLHRIPVYVKIWACKLDIKIVKKPYCSSICTQIYYLSMTSALLHRLILCSSFFARTFFKRCCEKRLIWSTNWSYSIIFCGCSDHPLIVFHFSQRWFLVVRSLKPLLPSPLGQNVYSILVDSQNVPRQTSKVRREDWNFWHPWSRGFCRSSQLLIMLAIFMWQRVYNRQA